MEIKGDEFLKNVQIKQEEESLRDKINQSESIRQQSNANPYAQYDNDGSQDQELGDILLNSANNSEGKDNKKKYVILGISLVLLFIITLVIIKLLSGNNQDAQFEEESKLAQEKLTNDQKVQQEYQKILTEKLKKVNENSQLTEEPIVQPVQEEPVKENPLEMPVKKEVKPEPVVEKTVQAVVPKPAVEPVKKEVVKTPEVKKSTQNTNPYVAKGIFVQIGAFSKKPNDKFLADITSKGYSYKLHTVSVNGKSLLKLLIGPYSSKADALKNVDAIKKTFNAPNAYVLQL